MCSAAACAGATAVTPLWHLQVSGNAKAVTYKVLAVVKDALLVRPNPNVQAWADLEKVLQLRLIVGAPANSGPSDPDGVGFMDWQLVIYASSLDAALTFIDFLLDCKVQKHCRCHALIGVNRT